MTTDDLQAGESRRDFLYLTTAALGGIGLAGLAWPFIDTMNPAADTLALATIEVDLEPVEPGQAITVMWRGKPVFVRHRSRGEVLAAQAMPAGGLPDPQADAERVQRPEWLVVVGVCTHLGCVPLGQRPTDPRGEFGGWFCPCHGSHYDTSGRIRRGPAPTNLPVPPYDFVEDMRIRIG
jgi:ubiquinol-cytochrome c reductase iron-sulfur subunit